MLNYLSAELWRMTRRKQNLIWCGGYLALVALAGVLWASGSFVQVLEAFEDFLVMGLYICFPIAALADGDLWRSGTPLCNEASYGLPRSRIYLGKLLAALLMGLVLFLLTAMIFLTTSLSAGALLRMDVTGVREAWSGLMTGILVALPRYFGALGLAHLLCFTLRSEGVGAVLYYLYLMLGEVVLGAAQLHGFGALDDLLNWAVAAVRPFLLSTGFFTYSTNLPPQGVLQSWGTGFLWLAVTTAVGVAVFRRRELK